MAISLFVHFGEIDTSNLDEYYDCNVDFNGQEIQIDLNFEEKTISAEQLDTIRTFLDKIEQFDKQNREYIEHDYSDDDSDTVRTYVEHHLEEIDREELSGLIDFENNSISPEKQLMKALHLVRIGLYPHSEESFAIFDYSIGKEITDYLVVINTDVSGNLEYMTMES